MSDLESAADRTEAAAVWQRRIGLPRHLRAVDGRDELVAVVKEIRAELGFARLMLVTGQAVSLEIGRALAPDAARFGVEESSVEVALELAADPGVAAADALLAVGGGKAIDVAKYAGRQAGLPVVSVPTQLSTDGICSPISVLMDPLGHVESLPAQLPIAVVADIKMFASAPPRTTRAGLGDALANCTALVDWRLAASAGRERVDDFAALLAQAAFEAVYGSDVGPLGRGKPEPDFLTRLLNALVLSGLAMEIAGSSRPCSGAEHLISHAIDRLMPGTAYHGEQVAFGMLIAARLQEGDWRSLKRFVEAAGMREVCAGFGLTVARLTEIVQAAPATRPGRYTCLNEMRLDAKTLKPMIEEVLSG